MAKAFVGIMLVVIAKSGKEIYWLTKTEGVINKWLSIATRNKKGFLIIIIIIMFIKILDWQFTIIKIEIEKLKFTIDDKYMAYM